MQHTTREWQQLEANHHLHPFTDFQALNKKGSRIITKGRRRLSGRLEGKRILDRMAGLVRQHGLRPSGAGGCRHSPDAQLPYYNLFFQTSPPAAQAGTLLAEITPFPPQPRLLHRLGFRSATTPCCMVRHYWASKGQPDKQVIISRHNAHGSTVAGASLGGMKGCTPRAACPFRA